MFKVIGLFWILISDQFNETSWEKYGRKLGSKKKKIIVCQKYENVIYFERLLWGQIMVPEKISKIWPTSELSLEALDHDFLSLSLFLFVSKFWSK